ncbi:hypothetical protein ABT160_42955 [Streptomyces sp. NPDC001941]|uniref:hypothetical protein n=1 Tax=Streptomyces sp. NPDC001941 TaxID=3154659 RepID=UPI003331902A
MTGKTTGSAPATLRLVKEARLRDLVGKQAGTRLEASGVLYRGGVFLVVCDNVRDLLRVGSELSPKAPENGVLRARAGKRAAQGYEDLAYDPSGDRYFALTESVAVKGRKKAAGRGGEKGKGKGAAKGADPGFRAKVRAYDGKLRPGREAVLDFPLPDTGKGIEGLECVVRGGTAYLLGLCEGNRCASGAAGRKPGGGRIQVFRQGGGKDGEEGDWKRVGTVRLPASLPFEDYASVSVRGERIAVLSQASSALWVGRLAPDAWEVVDEGAVYRLPPDSAGRTVYGNAEGVCWVSGEYVVIVSDRAKPGPDRARHRTKDQSVHLFLVPGGTGPATA